MKTKFHIYIIEEESSFAQKKVILTKVQKQSTYNGFDTYEEAEKWIIESGDRQVDYTILPTFRHP